MLPKNALSSRAAVLAAILSLAPASRSPDRIRSSRRRTTSRRRRTSSSGGKPLRKSERSTRSSSDEAIARYLDEARRQPCRVAPS